MLRKWTTDQHSAIATRGCDLLVSASAGSGKTSVMIERIASIIESGEAAPHEILVLTFTKESARDMKCRLSKRLDMHSVDISLSSVGTFHKFCSDLVQTYFSIVGVNPSFAVMDDGSAVQLQNEVLDSIIERNYLECSDAIDSFCTPASVKNLKDIIISITEFLNTRDNPKDWLENNAFAGYQCDLCQNVAMQGIINHYTQAGEYFCKQFTPSLDCFLWAQRLANVKAYGDLHNIALTFDKLKPMKKDVPEYTAKENLNKLLKKIKEQYILSEKTMIENQSADRELVRQVVTLVNDYMSHYAMKKAERNFLDFADLEADALEILNDAQINVRTREKYKFIFVDEYQDTNPVQERILTLLAGDSRCEFSQSDGVATSRNIFAVGDVKQSIYGFRGTEAAIFTDRMKRYQENALDSRIVKLNANFRSNPGILKFVNSVFERIMRETTAGNSYDPFEISGEASIDDAVEIITIEKGTNQQEAAIIAEKIVELKERGVSYNDIAILARSSTHFDTLIDVLTCAGIKCITDKKQNAEDVFEIALLNNMLYAAQYREYELPAVLLQQSFIFNVSAEQLAQVKLSKQTDKNFIAFQDKYHELCKQKPVADVLTAFIAEYNIIDKLLITPDGDRRVQNIYNFLNKLRSSSYASTVAQYLYLLENELLDIKIESSHGGGECVRVTPQGQAGVCRVMTIHSAKGLEFDNVFLYDMGAAFSSAEKRKSLIVDKTCGMCVYSTDPDEFSKHVSIARLGAVILANRVQIAEEMRLLYVALTRAKNRLVIVGSTTSLQTADVARAQLDDFEILNARNYLDFIRPTDVVSADEIKVLNRKKEQRVLTGKPDVKLVKTLQQAWNKEYSFKAAVNAAQKASVTSLTKREEDFIDYVPRRIGFEKDRGAEYGTKFHKAMQSGNYFDDRMKTGHIAEERSDDMLYDKTKKCAGIIEPLVKDMTVYKELMFLQNVEKDGEQVLVQGVIDLLAVGSDHAILIDYKTTNANVPKLIEFYKPQLDMYSEAVTQALGLKVEKYIYSTVHSKLIQVI